MRVIFIWVLMYQNKKGGQRNTLVTPKLIYYEHNRCYFVALHYFHSGSIAHILYYPREYPCQVILFGFSPLSSCINVCPLLKNTIGKSSSTLNNISKLSKFNFYTYWDKYFNFLNNIILNKHSQYLFDIFFSATYTFKIFILYFLILIIITLFS